MTFPLKTLCLLLLATLVVTQFLSVGVAKKAHAGKGTKAKNKAVQDRDIGYDKNFAREDSDYDVKNRGSDLEEFDGAAKKKKSTKMKREGTQVGDILQNAGAAKKKSLNQKLNGFERQDDGNVKVSSTTWNQLDDKRNENGIELNRSKLKDLNNNRLIDDYEDNGNRYNRNNLKYVNQNRDKDGEAGYAKANKINTGLKKGKIEQKAFVDMDYGGGELVNADKDTVGTERVGASSKRKTNSAQNARSSRNAAKGRQSGRLKQNDTKLKKKAQKKKATNIDGMWQI